MRAARYLLLLLIPLGGVWLYALAQSGGQVLALIRSVPGSTEATPVAERAVVPAQSGRDESPKEDAAPVHYQQDNAAESHEPPSQSADFLPQPFEDHGPTGSGGAPQAEIEHPEVTDPKMRRLLQPAWDD